jgi:putative aldouronate transport system substrate-binding protein
MRKAILLAAAVSLAVLAGGGAAWAKGAGEAASGQSAVKGYDYGDTGGIQLPLVSKPTTLKYYVQEHPSTPFKKDWVIWKNLSEATGIAFDFVVVGADTFEQKMRLLYSTNDLPDIVATRLFLANEFGSQGGIENIFANLDKLPNFSKALKTYPDAKAMITTLDNKAYYFPVLGTAKYLLTYLYRSDTFQKLGITPPVFTDDFEAALKKLREAYPDVYPFSSRRGITDQFSFFATIAPQWKTGQNMYLDLSTDTYKFGPIEDNYKRMLQYFNKLYNEKLLDPEWATLATKQWEDKLINSRTFVTLDYIYRIETMLPAARAVNPEWTLDGLMPITEKGFGQPKLWVRNNSSDTDGFLVPPIPSTRTWR